MRHRVYVGPYLRVERVTKTIRERTDPRCCDTPYRQLSDVFCTRCGKRLVAGARRTQVPAVDYDGIVASVDERLTLVTSSGLSLDEHCDVWKPGLELDRVELPQTDDVSAREIDVEHVVHATRCFRDQFASEIDTVNAAYEKAHGRTGEVVYGVLTYWT